MLNPHSSTHTRTRTSSASCSHAPGGTEGRHSKAFPASIGIIQLHLECDLASELGLLVASGEVNGHHHVFSMLERSTRGDEVTRAKRRM